jgi:hypothetical protein
MQYTSAVLDHSIIQHSQQTAGLFHSKQNLQPGLSDGPAPHKVTLEI